MLWQSICLRSAALWAMVSQHSAWSVSFIILQSRESLTLKYKDTGLESQWVQYKNHP
ncbi:hypothetical protein I79_017567 [Cricetulus griseus]|uniref:Secreted protein n=1 Tax=Cricetulus griseus TaxID=10029 RepID=G3I2D7_CRIGR|nr:hypothetical protein I79_017567 [Cricetulus griseus]